MNIKEYKIRRRAKDKKDYHRYLGYITSFVLLMVLCGIGIGLLGMFLAVFA